jgi:hypothetical protein
MSNDPRAGAGAQALGDMSADLAERWTQADIAIWEKSPLYWLFNLRSGHRRGAAGEELMSKWLTDAGLGVRPSPTTDFDRWVDLPVGGGRSLALSLEIKTATGSKAGYQSLWWNQIRGWSGYTVDAILLFGYTPFDAYIWIVPHNLAFENARAGDGGAKGDGLNRLVNFRADNPPAWIAPWGGPSGRINPQALLTAVADYNAKHRR